MAPAFRFQLGQIVRLIDKNEAGTVAARGEFLGGQIKYIVQRLGGATWVNDAALEPIEPEAAPESGD